jgi:hypothetical protein
MRRFHTDDAFKALTQQIAINVDVFLHGYHHNKLSKGYQMGGKQYSNLK